MNQQRFDPVGWFVSTCFALLAGAAALAMAVHLVSTIWVWLAIGAVVVAALGLAIQLAVWWWRRRPW